MSQTATPALGRLRGYRLPILFGLVLLLAPLVLPNFQIFLLGDVMILIIFATGFNLLYGYTGYLSFGHAMFFGLAGYSVSWWLTDQVATPEFAMFGGTAPLVEFLVAVAFGIALATAVSVVVGFLSVRLEEIYFAMLTLSFSMALYSAALKNIGGLTNGTDGLTVILPGIDLFGIDVPLGNVGVFYYVIFLFFVPSMYALWRVVNSPFGMICKAIRENNTRAEAIGVNVTRYSWMSFVVSAFFSAIAGTLVVPLRNIMNPQLTHWTMSAEPVLIVVLGGAQNFAGPIAGTFAFRYLRWFITQFPALEARWQFFFGVLLLIVLLFFNRGVSGGLRDIYEWLVRVNRHYREGGSDAAMAYVNDSVADFAARIREKLPGADPDEPGERTRAD